MTVQAERQLTPQRLNQHSAEVIDEKIGIATLYMQPAPRPCFTTTLLQEIVDFAGSVSDQISDSPAVDGASPITHMVLASGIPGTFSLGGDLNLFSDAIERRDGTTLYDYAVSCINAIYRFYTGMEQPLTSVALVQGNAQGGGFEAALACNVLIAERGTFAGFPEVLFNLFPGMGAYSFLSRRVGATLAERMIFSGNLYSAEELYAMGVIDILADRGEGDKALARYVHDARRRSNATSMLRHVRHTYGGVTYEELHDVAQRWVDAALSLTDLELRVMQRLVRAQNRKMSAAS